MAQFFQMQDLGAITPELELVAFGMFLLIFDLMVQEKRRLGLIALAGIAISGFFLFRLRGTDFSAYGGVLALDPFSIFFKTIFLVAAALSVAISLKYLDIERENHGEYYALILFSTMGMMFMAGAVDLVTLYIGLETMAIATYVLVGFLRSNQRSNEASMKYFLLGAFSSGILLYGMSLLYGLSGSTRFVDIAEALSRRPLTDPISLLAMITLSAGMFFKVAAVPFHQWTPDAYEGAPTSITAFMSVAVKAASFAMMVRIFMVAIYPLRPQWVPIMAAVSVMTMTIGNIAAITQSNVKRMLAYSSISHAGYILIGFIAGNETGLTAVPLYLFIYTFTNLGAWAVIVALRRKDVIGEQIDDMAGLFFRHPAGAVLMLIFLLSLAGIPPTAGFIGKYYLFAAAIQTGHNALAVIAVLNAAISIYFYFRIVVSMFMREATEKTGLVYAPGLTMTLAIAIVFTLLIGVYPDPFIAMARQAVILGF
ncbi:MAG: NADH-quinone oxidoreductase subunit N [Acidobacteria bacterium]|nr:MAG: NADH-quinone oxidoreductase subunit N [Acidobacteriota bacterium]PYS08151.1 MAG: NADH-quinone oxidoreductase subunit N [Acidobacteriota bacterium]